MKKLKKLFAIVLTVSFVLVSINSIVFSSADIKSDEETSLHFINVNTNKIGYNDATSLSVLIKHKGKNILIDTGIDYDITQKYVVDYLKNQNVKKIDYLIITHFHNDHVGGFNAVMENFDVGKIYYKMTKELLTSNTYGRKYYDDVYLSIKYKVNSNGTFPKVIEPKKEGYHVDLDDETYFELYNCTEMFEEKNIGYDANFYSMMVKFISGGASAFIGGDAGDLNDKYVINKIGHVDVFGLQHHGCDLPYNSQAIFDELTPTYSVATTYLWDETVEGFNHILYLPGKGVYERAEKVNSKVILTGQLGDIVFDCNGENFILRNKL